VPKYLGTQAEAKVEASTQPTAIVTPIPEGKLAEAPPDDPKPAEAAPPAADKAPVIVEIGLVSKPPGASVFRGGETVPLGVTPFPVPLSRSDKPVNMRFEKHGFAPKTVEISLEDSLEIEVTLSKQQREPVAAKSAVRVRKPAQKPESESKPKPQ